MGGHKAHPFFFIHTDMTELEQIKFYSEHYQDYLPKCPIVIPSYKNRAGNLVQHLQDVSDNKIFVFVYKEDYENYKEYDCQPNVEFVQINENWRSIQKKRRYIQEFFVKRPEIERYVMIDDDMKRGKIVTDKDTTMYIPLKNALGLLEEYHLKFGYRTVSGPEFNSLAFAHTTKISKQNPFYQCYLFENDWVIKHPECRFRDLQNVAEDVIIWFDCNKNEQPYNCFQPLYLETNSSNNSIASSSLNLKKNQINALRIMKNECKIVISSSWNCWIPGIGKPCVFYQDIKEILDKCLPNWTDMNTQFTDEQFEVCFAKIDGLVKEKLIKPESDWSFLE